MTTLPQQRPLPQTPQALSEDEKSRISYLLERNWSENTEKTYGKAWRRFTDWAYARGVDPMPVSPQMVAAYLANLVEANLAVATIRTYKAALAAMHRRHGFEDPTDNEEVDRVMAGIAKVLGKPQRQARGLTGDDLAVVKAMARYPRANRAFRGGKETQERTERRARLDVALLSLLRDGLLRISEAANSRWCDIKVEKNGTGCLHILRSKTDQEGNGVLLFLGTKTMTALLALRPDVVDPEAWVFGLSVRQLSRRIKQATAAAELGEGFSGHSGRVGMAQDLTANGADLPALMQAGRWTSPAMPARYTEAQAAARGAVAKYYEKVGE